MTSTYADASEPTQQETPAEPSAMEGFRTVRLQQSGRRAATLNAADVWSGRVVTPCANAEEIRHDARLLIDQDGAPYLHILGQRMVAGEVAAWHAVLAQASDGLRETIDAYDPARLLADFDALAASHELDLEKIRAFAEQAAAVKTDLQNLIAEVGRAPQKQADAA